MHVGDEGEVRGKGAAEKKIKPSSCGWLFFCVYFSVLWWCGCLYGSKLQVVAHLMPDLPNMGMERDIESFREFFENPAFRADGLKVYPTLVIRGTGLYELWKTKRYRNYAPADLIDLVARILAMVRVVLCRERRRKELCLTFCGSEKLMTIVLRVSCLMIFFLSCCPPAVRWYACMHNVRFRRGRGSIVSSEIFPCLWYHRVWRSEIYVNLRWRE